MSAYAIAAALKEENERLKKIAEEHAQAKEAKEEAKKANNDLKAERAQAQKNKELRS